MTPDDGPLYQSILTRTSELDRYFRFFKPTDALASTDVRLGVEKRDDMVGLIALDGSRAVGAAHAALLGDRSAELAVIVAGDGRERGVGKTLLLTLITYLERRGFYRFVAHSLQDNRAFARLATSVGLQIEHVEGADVRWARENVPSVRVIHAGATLV